MYWYSVFAYICCVCIFLFMHLSYTIFHALDYKYNILEYFFYTLTLRGCLGVWLRLLFKVLFVPIYIKMMFFFKIIFDISTSKWSKNTKTYSFKMNKKAKAAKRRFDRSAKQTVSRLRVFMKLCSDCFSKYFYFEIH